MWLNDSVLQSHKTAACLSLPASGTVKDTATSQATGAHFSFTVLFLFICIGNTNLFSTKTAKKKEGSSILEAIHGRMMATSDP
jgi:hypothetical protein